MPLNNSNNDSWLNHTIFKALLAVVLSAGAGWCAYVNSQINQIDSIKTDIAIIRITLQEIQKDIHAQRHNP